MSAEKNYHFFLEHLADLIRDHADEYVLIADEKFVAFYKGFEEAVQSGKERFGMGNFIVQRCSDPSADAVVFHSRVLVKG